LPPRCSTGRLITSQPPFLSANPVVGLEQHRQDRAGRRRRFPHRSSPLRHTHSDRSPTTAQANAASPTSNRWLPRTSAAEDPSLRNALARTDAESPHSLERFPSFVGPIPRRWGRSRAVYAVAARAGMAAVTRLSSAWETEGATRCSRWSRAWLTSPSARECYRRLRAFSALRA